MQTKKVVIYSFPRSGRGSLSKTLGDLKVENHVEAISELSVLSENTVNVVVLRNPVDCLISKVVTQLHQRPARTLEYDYEHLGAMIEFWTGKYTKYLENIDTQSNKIFGFTFEDLSSYPSLVVRHILEEAFSEEINVEDLPSSLLEIETGYKKTFDSEGNTPGNVVYFLNTVQDSEHYQPVKALFEERSEDFVELFRETRRLQNLFKRTQIEKGISIPN